MSQEFSQYPLVQKIYDEENDYMGGAFRTNVLKRCVEIIEATIDRPAAEKEELMVGCALLIGSPRAFYDRDRFAAEYTPEIKELADSLARGEESDRTAQSLAACSIALTESTIVNLKKGILPEGITLVRLTEMLREQIVAEYPAVPLATTAPRLGALFQETMESGVAAAENFAAAPPSAPKAAPPKKRGSWGDPGF